MVAILIRCIDMSRQLLSNKPDEASLSPQAATKQDVDDDIQDILSSSWSPIPSLPDESVTLPSTTPLVGTMSDSTASRSKQKQPGDMSTPTDGKQDQEQQKLSSSRSQSFAPSPTPRSASNDEPINNYILHSASSSRHLRHHNEEEHRIEGEARINDPSYQYQYHPINHRYYQSRNQYNYHSGASYYNTPPDPDNRTSATATTMSSGQHYHHHSLYPGYYTTQDYGNHSHYPYDNRYLNYESTGSLVQDSAAAPSRPGPTRQYAHYYPYHHNHETENSPYYHHSFPHHDSFFDAEAVSSTVATTSTSAKDDSQGRKSLDISSSPDDEQKPSTREKQSDTRERKGSSKRRRDEDISISHHPDPQQQGQDFEPIPLNKISAIPILSTSSSSSTGIVSRSMLGGGGSGGGCAPYSHPASSYASPHATAVGDSRSRGSSAHVAPPMPHATTSTPSARKQPRILEPTSSGSNETTSSTPSWEKRFTELVGFKRAHGHCEVPQNYSENPSLGTWVNKVR